MTKAQSERDNDDLAALMLQPAFRRFLFRVIESSGIHASAYGSDERRLNGIEGRRSLGFDMLRWADEAQRIGAGDGLATLMQILIEASASTSPSETQNGRPQRPHRNRNDELLDDDDEPVRS